MAKSSFLSRVGKKVDRAVKKRYISKNSVPKIGQIMADVKLMKGLLNVEKKRYPLVIANTSVAQVYQNSNAYYTFNLTPEPAQGAGFSQRNGASIKLTSMYLKWQFYHQTASSAPIKGTIYICKIPGYTTVLDMTKFLSPNPFIGGGGLIYDYNSSRNVDYFKDYQLVKKQSFVVAADNLTGQIMIKNVTIGLKFKNHHVRFDGNTNNVATGALVAFIVVDSGNNHPNAASTLSGVITTAHSTGLIFGMNGTAYYVDN